MLLTFLSLVAALLVPAKPDTSISYLVFRPDGTPSSLSEIVDVSLLNNAVFIGETHDDSLTHVVQLEIFKKIWERLNASGEQRRLVLAMEMFERDVQTVLDEYLSGQIRERDFLAAARPWSNYDRDYKPLIAFAKDNGVPVVASNAPARYVSFVGRNGPDSLGTLSEEAKSWLPDLPYAPASDEYAAKFRETMARMMQEMAAARDTMSAGLTRTPPDSTQMPAAPDSSTSAGPGHGSGFMLEAQNLRDAAMGRAVAEVSLANPSALVLHINGSFHSDAGLGTPEHARALNPELHSLIVSIIDEGYPDFDAEKMGDRGDFIILAPGR